MPQATVIQVSATSHDPAATPPVFNTIAGALASITDNGPSNRYRIEVLSGTYNEHDLVLKDCVDIFRAPSAETHPVIWHDFPANAPSDIFKTFILNGVLEDHFPIRCKLKGLHIRGKNLNYPLHGDHNSHPGIQIEVEDCILFNGDDATTAEISNYGAGFGVYGGQRYVFNRCTFYGRYDPGETNLSLQQGSGWIVHNRAAQTEPCSVEFNDCFSAKGWYGGRIVDYGSGQKDTVSIRGGALWGEFANLLCFANTGVTVPSITVMGNAPVRIVRTHQNVGGGTILRNISPIVITGFSSLYQADGAIERGDLISVGVFQKIAKKAETGVRYKYKLGVALHAAANGEPIAVQEFGVAAVKFDPAITAAQVEVSNSASTPGMIRAAIAGDGIIGTTAATTAFAASVTDGLALMHLQYAGTKN